MAQAAGPAREKKMLIAFSMAAERYGLEWQAVAAVAPLAKLAEAPGPHTALSGLLDYHGAKIPVVDLCRLILGRPCSRHFSTRILIVDVPVGRVGLMVERANETVDLLDAPVRGDGVYLFRIAGEEGQEVTDKEIELGRLLGQVLRSSFPGAAP